MNIEKLGRKAIDIIKSKWSLPDKGILAGGSISNLVWELVSGNKSKINDLDIFVNIGYIDEKEYDSSPIYEKRDLNRKYEEHYSGLSYRDETKRIYTINEATQEGIYNTIKYKSSTEDYFIVIKSFDLNCTQLGYIIEEDKLIWTPDFENFINTGELKIVNIQTPAHTVIRIVKKQKDLNCKLDDFEINLCKHVIMNSFIDKIRLRFKDKYFKMFKDNLEILSKHFNISHDNEAEDYIKRSYHDFSSIYSLDVKGIRQYNKTTLFKDDNIYKMNYTPIFLFYMRNIYGNDKLKHIWYNLKWFFNDLNYIDDLTISKDDIELLGRLTRNAPNTIEKLKGYTLSQQVTLFNRLLREFKNDPIIAISILEKNSLSIDFDFNEDNKLLLELSVRKEIVNDKSNKVNSILYPEKKKKEKEELDEFDLDL